MTKGTIGKLTSLIFIFAALIFLFACSSTPAPTTAKPSSPAAPAPASQTTTAPASPKPATTTITSTPAQPKATRMITISVTGGTSGGGYSDMVALIEPFRKTGVGIEIKPDSVASSVAAMQALKENKITAVHCGSTVIIPAWNAEEDFKTAGWKPMYELREVWTLTVAHNTLMARGDSDIKSVKDIKGKRMAINTASSSSKLQSMAILAFAGLTESDVKVVNVPAFDAQAQAVKDGTADVGVGNITAAASYELESSPHGIKLFAFPADDVQGWERYHKVSSSVLPNFATKGAGVPAGGLWVPTIPFPVTTVASQDPELVYLLAKGITLAYPGFRDARSEAYMASPRYASDPAFMVPGIPYHEGAVRWMKEIGCWTPEIEKWQQDCLKAIGATK